jgi:hypothetical protein
MSCRVCSQIVVLLVLAFCLSLNLMGQADTGTVSGLVSDPSGGVLVGATVELLSLDHGNITTTTSNKAGIYMFASVQPGRYQITVRQAGFRQLDFLNLVINTQDHIEQNFRLEVGSIAESVTVEAGAPVINTSDASLGRPFETRQVEQLPIEGRNVV